MIFALSKTELVCARKVPVGRGVAERTKRNFSLRCTSRIPLKNIGYFIALLPFFNSAMQKRRYFYVKKFIKKQNKNAVRRGGVCRNVRGA